MFVMKMNKITNTKIEKKNIFEIQNKIKVRVRLFLFSIFLFMK